MDKHFKDIICKSCHASDAYEIEVIQSLWSGYGQIIRFGLKGALKKSVIVKYVRLKDQGKHPRGWNSDRSHQRKLRSYRIETSWYQKWSSFCDDSCRVPECIAAYSYDGDLLLILEDLDEIGFHVRKNSVSKESFYACLSWLAHFHATFLGEKPECLWKIGTYWHLNTRPDELKALKDKELKKAAIDIDKILNRTAFKTFVHGDAKLANFCFCRQGKNVAAVDFQYVGGGCGMKDVAYFVGSCFYENECEKMESELLNFYFKELKKALIIRDKKVDFEVLEKDWRALYHVAWTDFHRFLKGWSPEHWKINGYSERVARQVLKDISKKM